MKMGKDLILLDLETNAEDIPDIGITQIGAVRLEASTLKEKSYFNQDIYVDYLSPRSIRVTGITKELLEGKPSFGTAGKDFQNWVESGETEYILSSWGTHFDIPMLRWMYRRNTGKFPFMGQAFCVKSALLIFLWVRGIPIKRCGVEKALQLLDLKFEGKPHDALDDARNEARILRVISGVMPPGPKAQVQFGRFVGNYGKMIADADLNDPEPVGET
jgi:DNA polymerase III epsilon subunit-like protein